MKRHILIFGAIGGVLIAALQWMQYRFLVIEHSVEIYAGLVAATFAALGIWLGRRITGRAQSIPEPVVIREVPIPAEAPAFTPDPKKLGLTPREFEILELIAAGLSNREIAARLFVSENTVKTHASRVLQKLGAERRTQAVQLGKQLGLLR